MFFIVEAFWKQKKAFQNIHQSSKTKKNFSRLLQKIFLFISFVLWFYNLNVLTLATAS